LVERPARERDAAAEAAAGSVEATSWNDAGAAFERIVMTVMQNRHAS
jgi:hypothetical protein